MAEKSASIKVDLKSDQAKAGIRGLGSETKKVAGEMGSSLQSALSTGMKGGVDAVKSAFSSIKSTVLSLGGLAGGLGIAELARGAIQSEGAYRKIAFQIHAGTGEMVAMRDIQKETHAAALKTGQASDDLAKSMAAVFSETGNAEFARKSIETIGTAAKGAHEPLETMTGIAGTLNEKFGITEDQLGGALSTIVGLGNKGGISVGDMGEKLGLIGAYAKEAGLQGEQGLGTIVGMLNLADNANGSFKKGISAVGGLLEQLGSTVGKNKIGAALGVSAKDLSGSAPQQIEAILKATKGQKANLEKAFGGEQLKLLVDLGKTYSGAFEETKGDVKSKTAAALSAVRSSFEAASKSSLSYADLQNEAAKEMQTGEGKVQTALEKLRQAFAKPEITAAIEKLMGALPALADIIAKVVGFAADNPAAAAGAAIGGTFAKGAIESIIVGAFKSGAAAAAPSLSGALAGGAGPFASALGPLMGPIGLALGASLGIMLIASMHQAKLDQEARDAAARGSQKMLKGKAGPMGGAYQAAGALEAATGVEFDPSTAISDETAGQATGGLAEHDKVMQERAMKKAGRNEDLMKFGNKLAQNHPEWFQTETPSSGASGTGAAPPPVVSGTQSKAPAIDPQVLAAANASALAGKTLNVYVKNASDIGGGGSGGAPTGKGFTVPGYVVR